MFASSLTSRRPESLTGSGTVRRPIIAHGHLSPPVSMPPDFTARPGAKCGGTVDPTVPPMPSAPPGPYVYAGSNSAIVSKWCVIGNASKDRSVCKRQPSLAKVFTSRPSAAGSQAT